MRRGWMSSKREELKKKLLLQAEKAIDKMLEDERLSEKMTLSQIEEVIGDSEAEFGQSALEAIVSHQHESPIQCPKCGGKLKNKGKRRKQIVSLNGELEVSRNYYVCIECGAGYFPPR